MSCHGNKGSFLNCSKATDDGDGEDINTNIEKQPGHFKRSFTPLPTRPGTSASVRDAFRRGIFRRRLSMSDSPRFSLRFNSAEISRIFDFGGNGRTRATSIGSSSYGLLQPLDGQTATASSELFRDDTGYADGSSTAIVSFRGGPSWRHLDPESDQLCLDLFWSSQKENPFRPDIMPLEELAPLSNFRNLRSLKLTGMLQSYQVYIWQAVWLNPGLEDLHLEMALEPCIRQTFCASWPKIRGKWVPRTAVTVRNLYYGKNGRGELQRRVGFGEYLDKYAIGAAKEAATALGPTPEKLPVVKLTLMGFVVDSDPFFLWFNPHRLRTIDFKDHCVDAGFALPVRMSEHVVVSWPPADNIGEPMWARRVRPGEIKLIDLGSKKGDKKDKGKAAVIPCGGTVKESHKLTKKPGGRVASNEKEEASQGTNTTQEQPPRRLGGLLNIGGRRFVRKKK